MLGCLKFSICCCLIACISTVSWAPELLYYLQYLAYPHTISIGLSSQWNFGRKTQIWPRPSMYFWMSGFSFWKSDWHERTWLIQHQSDRGSRSVSTDSRVSTASSSASCPAASAAATHALASLAACDFLQHSHVPTGLPLGDFSHRMSHMVPHSFKTAFIPFALPHRSGLGSLSAYTMSCTWPHGSGAPGGGGGLSKGMIVECILLCLPPGLTFILLIFRASAAKPSWLDEQSKIHTPTQLGNLNSKILIALCSWSDYIKNW